MCERHLDFVEHPTGSEIHPMDAQGVRCLSCVYRAYYCCCRYCCITPTRDMMKRCYWLLLLYAMTMCINTQRAMRRRGTNYLELVFGCWMTFAATRRTDRSTFLHASEVLLWQLPPRVGGPSAWRMLDGACCCCSQAKWSVTSRTAAATYSCKLSYTRTNPPQTSCTYVYRKRPIFALAGTQKPTTAVGQPAIQQ